MQKLFKYANTEYCEDYEESNPIAKGEGKCASSKL